MLASLYANTQEQMQEVLEGAKGLKESLAWLMKFEDIFFRFFLKQDLA